MNRLDSPKAIRAVDDLLASVGLGHGRRTTLANSWQNGERRPRLAQPARQTTPTPAAQRKVEPVRASGWLRYPWLRHGFSTRAGGISSIYGDASLNLGWTDRDNSANVAENRRHFMAEIAGEPSQATTLRQLHSAMVRILDTDDCARLHTPDDRAVLRGDAAMTNLPGVFLGIQTADCVPVLVADVRRRAVAAFHAGWRGTLARIVQRGIGTMRLRYGSRPQDLIAVIGPSIGPCCYSVGEELRFDFDSQFAYAPQLFTEVYDSDPVRDKYPLLFLTARAPGHSNIGPQIHLNLWEANRRQLLDAGVPDKRITVVAECTACTGLGTSAGRKYFSHRAECGFTGRMMAVVGIAAASTKDTGTVE